jgi:integrase
VGETTNELPVRPEENSRVERRSNPPLSLVVDSFLTEKALPSKTAHEVKATFKRFQAVCGGEDRLIKDVTKGDVRLFREALLRGDSKQHQGRGRLAPATVNKYLGLLASVFAWATDKAGLLDVNPAKGIGKVGRNGQQHEGQETKRQPFTDANLKTLFSSALYTDPAMKAKRPALFWVYPMMLYSGARLEEVMGLRVQDMREIDDVLCFVIESREDRRLKNISSRRTIPVHENLKRLGLVEWRDKQPADALLFPCLITGR